MQTSDELLRKRFSELAGRAEVSGKVIVSDFLNLHEQSLLTVVSCGVPVTLFGGFDGAERKAACFGAAALQDAKDAADFRLLRIAPANPKFADALSHRDFLGSMLSLGLRREKLGDILLADNCAYVFCTARAADFLAENLERVRHTTVRCAFVDTLPPEAEPVLEPREAVIASERLDALVAAVFHLSRSEAQKLIAAERVSVDSAAVLRADALPKPGQILSVRGHGRFRYDGILRETKKGKLRAQVSLYV